MLSSLQHPNRGEGELSGLPVDVVVVASEPRETQDEFKVPQRHDMAGKVLRVDAVDA